MHQIPPFSASMTLGGGGRKVVKPQRDGENYRNEVFKTYKDAYTYLRDYGRMHRACTSLRPMQGVSQPWEGKWTQSLTLNTEVISYRYLLANEKLLFSNGVSLGMQTTFNARFCAHICCIKQIYFHYIGKFNI